MSFAKATAVSSLFDPAKATFTVTDRASTSRLASLPAGTTVMPLPGRVRVELVVLLGEFRDGVRPDRDLQRRVAARPRTHGTSALSTRKMNVGCVARKAATAA